MKNLKNIDKHVDFEVNKRLLCIIKITRKHPGHIDVSRYSNATPII